MLIYYILNINNLLTNNPPIMKDKVIEIFVDIDDFIKDLDQMALKTSLLGDNVKRRNRASVFQRLM